MSRQHKVDGLHFRGPSRLLLRIPFNALRRVHPFNHVMLVKRALREEKHAPSGDVKSIKIRQLVWAALPHHQGLDLDRTEHLIANKGTMSAAGGG